MRTSARFPLRRVVILLILFAFLITTPAFCQQAPIELPKPQITGGMPLMQALAQRQTTRAFRDQPLSRQMLSNLLWAAFGVNRPRDVKPGLGRTAPSAMNRQEIELDVVLVDGVFAYDAEKNTLRLLVPGDVRSQISPPAAAHAAVTIVYVAPAGNQFAQVDAGFIGQNLYLFAASEGLNAWFYTAHGMDVAGALKLPAGRQVLYLQSAGYPPS
ncbi:MAG TPA: SagB/ThcOx family dehydrogenase [Terracidiphilus sp.]|nr:SagB/ThcOx family dehydrogenase [Terracidiphilus sp.]